MLGHIKDMDTPIIALPYQPQPRRCIALLCNSVLMLVLAIFSNHTYATVTYDGTQGVFNQIFSSNCATSGCHNGAQSPNLTNFSAASSNSALIATRMGSAGSPMPPSGQLSGTLISLASSWNSDGALENAAPQVTTGSATSVTKTSATLTGTLFENGVETSMVFQYSTASNLSGALTSSSSTGSGTGGGTSGASISIGISSLTCGTTYYYRGQSNANGTYSSQQGSNGIQNFTTSACNVQPVISSTAPTSATEDVQYSYQVLVTDSDDSSFTYGLSGEPSGMTINSAGLIRWTPTNGVTTSGTVTVSAADGGEDGVTPATETFTVTVAAVNDPPTITSTASTTATEDTLYTYTATVSDVDDSNNGTDLTWSLANEPSGMVVSSTGQVTWTPGNGVSTSGTVTLTVQDGGENGASPDTENFSISVTAVNDPPIITSTASTTATEDTLYTYTATVSDIDDSNNGTDLTWSLSNEPSGMVVSSTGRVTWTPGNGVSTSGTVTLTVQDGGENGVSPDTENFTISVTAVNDPPSITTSAPTSATEGNLYTYTAGVTDVDDANDGTNLTWSLSNEPSGMVVSSTGQVTWTPGNGVSTSGNVTLTVQDGGENGSSPATEMFTITVAAFNTPPSITSTAPTTATEDVQYSYQVQVTDADDTNDGTNLSFVLSNEPSGMTVSSTGLITWTPTEGVTSSGSVTVTVSDGGEDGAGPDTEIFSVVVTSVNDAPTITSTAGTTATEDIAYNYTPTVVDPDDANDGTNLTWSLSNEPSGMTISSTGAISWTPTEGVSTSGTVTVTVADGGEDSASAFSENFTVAVTAVNDPPSITSTASTTATEDTLYTYTATVSDVDDSNNGTDLIWSLANEPSGMVVSSTGEVTWTPTEGVSTSGTVTLSVSDGGEDSAAAATEDFTINVTAVNDAPLISSVAPTSGLEANQYSYQVTVTDPDDSNNGTDLNFVLSNAPVDMNISNMGLITWVPPEGATTSGEITLTVSDGGEDSAAPAEQRFTISVGIFNSPPSINSTAPTTATEDIEYTYQLSVSDVDDPNNGADLSFSLTNAPTGMTVSTTGLISWTPTEGVLTSNTVTVTVADGGEDSAAPATETFTITVTPVNDAPLITSTAPTAVVELNSYSYLVTVTDPDDANDGSGALNFALSNAPSGMTISNTGLIEWVPGEGTRTSGQVTVTVSDGGEDSAQAAQENFTINVIEFNTPPAITSQASATATEDIPYSYQVVIDDIDDPNDGSGALTFVLMDAPTGMTVSNTGLINWTPTEGVLTSGTVTLIVTDGGEDNAASAQEQITITVTAVNDAPVITSTAPTTINEDETFSYQVAVTDPDDNNDGLGLSYSLTNAPTGMAISRIGLITWPTDENSPLTSTITVTVIDGAEDGVQPVNQTFTLTVVFDIDSDGVANDEDNCRTTANADQANNDGDSNGDACDSDDDNDGISDEFEVANNLNPFDPSDASEDPDNDGLTNLEEFNSNRNPNIDDTPPVVTAPSNILRLSTGFETFVDVGQAVATDSLDGPVTATPSMPSGGFSSGRHIVTWTATDAQGNSATAEQIVDVIPQISVVSNQSIEEGQIASVVFALNGDPVRFPVSVDYSLSGTADGNDHNLVDGTLALTSATATLRFNILADNVVEGTENLILTLANPVNATLSNSIIHQLDIVESNIAPTVELSVEQAGMPGLIVTRNGGLVTINTSVSDPNINESFTYDWGNTDNSLSSVIGLGQSSFVIDPMNLAEGIYKVGVVVADSSGGLSSNEVIIRVSDNAAVDANSNGIDDAVDQSTENFVLQVNTETTSLETEPTLSLRLGETAIHAGADSLTVSLQELQDLGDSGQPANAQTDFTFSSDLLDFVIDNLSFPGQSVSVIFPLSSGIPENAVYRKFSITSGWNDFVVDDNNKVASAPSVENVCPGPGAESYQDGLTAGNDCVQLTIEDGGPNDADATANGVIQDPGGVATPAQTTSAGSDNNNSNGGSSGGGAIDFMYLFILLLLVLKTIYRGAYSR